MPCPHPSAATLAAALALTVLGGCPRHGSDTNGPVQDDAPAVSSPDGVPNVRTPAAQLSTPSLQHTELVRITRNFGKANFEIALDAWTPIDNPSEIAEVRLWWAKNDRDGERGPFSAKSRDHFDIEYERLGPAKWRVDLGSDKHVYRFWIELDETGAPAAFADVDADGGRLEHCRVTQGSLEARKLFGAPVGIRGFSVTCVDADGRERNGAMFDAAASD